MNGFKPWIAEVAEKSSGSLKINYFTPNTLCPDKDSYDAAVSGVADLGATLSGYAAGKFPITEVCEMPFIYPGSEAASLGFWKMYQKYPEIQNEYKDAKMMFMWSTATMQIHTAKKMVRTLEDIKGLRIISLTALSSDILRSLGANPIEIPTTDAYLALQRNMADGILLPLAPARSFKITDVCKYHTICDVTSAPIYGVMNTNKFNSLTPEQQKVLNETTGEKLSRRLGQTLDEGSVADCKWMKTQGHEFYVLPGEEKARWVEACTPMYENWIKKMESKGVTNAREVFNEAERLGKELASQTGRGYQE